MKTTKFSLRNTMFLIFCLLSQLVWSQENKKKKLSRADSFWGLHFDKHSNINDKNLGESLTEQMVDSLLRLARPDYIQVDSKGHPGVSSYPTLVGQQAKSYTKDPLALIRKVTDKHHVSLYVHYSGLVDANYVKLHPGEARLDADGKPDVQQTSLWGKYTDQLLIPQLKEIALTYKVDGAWIDGEAWGVMPDYQPQAIKEFQQETGILSIPRSAEDPGYKSLLEFNRKKFISYIKHYTDEVHKSAPKFEICSNWAYSALMPEAIDSNMHLNFLSGDYDPENSYETANWNARCLAEQGLPFDLMAWSFTRPSALKSAVQLCQEAAAVISVGGGCQVYFRQNVDLSFQPVTFKVMKEVADFMLPRREFCKNISVVPQIGIFYSNAGWKKNVNDVYRPFGVEAIRGVLNAVLDGQHSAQVLMTHQLRKRMNEFPMIIVPEWDTLEVDVIKQLKAYVYNGGRLLIAGPNAAANFQDILGVEQSAEVHKINKNLYFNGGFADIGGNFSAVRPLQDTRVVANLYETTDLRFPAEVLATSRKYGKGAVAGIYVDAGKLYSAALSPAVRDLFSGLITELDPDLLVKVTGSKKLHVVTTKKDNRLLVQLINTSGDHANVNIKGVDEIMPLRGLQASLTVAKKPSRVLLQPGRTELPFTYQDGKLNFTIPEVKIHNIIEIAL